MQKYFESTQKIFQGFECKKEQNFQNIEKCSHIEPNIYGTLLNNMQKIKFMGQSLWGQKSWGSENWLFFSSFKKVFQGVKCQKVQKCTFLEIEQKYLWNKNV